MLRALALAALVVATALAGCAEPDAQPTGAATTPTTTSVTTPTGATTTPTTTTPVAPTAPEPPATDAAADVGATGTMAEGDYRATITTNLGDIVVELYEDKAPLHVANFLQYAQQDHYANTVFHRVVEGFVIQGGGFAAPFDGASDPKPTNAPIPVERWDGMTHATGTLGMARTSDPNSATSQWFINTADNANLDAGYTVFGAVVEGMDVVRAIESAPTTTKAQFQGVPVEDVVIESVSVQTPDVSATPALAAYRESYGLAPGGEASFPLYLRNVGGAPLDATLLASGSDGVMTSIEHTPAPLAPGQAGVAIVRVTARQDFAGGAVAIRAFSPEGASDDVTLRLTMLAPSDAAAGDAHPKVSAHYVGLYDNGVVFDTTLTGLDARGFPMPVGFTEHPDPLKVWVGESGADTGGYTPVIEGFRDGIVGLHEGETRTTRLTPEEGYQDGRYRIFEMQVASIDG